MKLADALKTSPDELRMQMLGTLLMTLGYLVPLALRRAYRAA